VTTVIVHQSHVPAEVMAIYKTEAEVLPAWYPGAGGMDR